VTPGPVSDMPTPDPGAPAGAPATVGTLFRARAAGGLDAAEFRRARGALADRAWWAKALAWTLLLLGIAHLIAAAFFIFAANWQAWPRGVQLALALAAPGLAGLAALILGPDGRGGRVATTATALLVGLALAVFGQIYQTGADSWLLFALWAGFALPLALLARFALLWLIWAALAGLAAGLGTGQALAWRFDLQAYHTLLLPGVTLAATGILVHMRPGGDRLWPPPARATSLSLLTAGATLATLAGCAEIFQMPRAPFALAASLALLLGGAFWRRFATRDVTGTAIFVVALAALATAGVARGLFEAAEALTQGHAEATTVLIGAAALGLWLGALMAGLHRYFKHLPARIRAPGAAAGNAREATEP